MDQVARLGVQIPHQPQWQRLAETASRFYNEGKSVCIVDATRSPGDMMIIYHAGEGRQCTGLGQHRQFFISALSKEEKQRFYQIFQQKRVCTCRPLNKEFQF